MMILLQLVLPAWIAIAPGIQAQPNLTVGDAAYAKCMMSPNTDSVVCQSAKSTAIQMDIHDRFTAFFHDLVAGRITDVYSLNVYLNYYQMRLTPVPTTIPTPFGPVPANPPANPATNPFPGN